MLAGLEAPSMMSMSLVSPSTPPGPSHPPPHCPFPSYPTPLPTQPNMARMLHLLFITTVNQFVVPRGPCMGYHLGADWNCLDNWILLS